MAKIRVWTRARNARTRRSRVRSGLSVSRKPRTSKAAPTPIAAVMTSHGRALTCAPRNCEKKYAITAAMPMAKPRGPKRRMYTPPTMIATNTVSATTGWGASTVPSATAAMAGSTSSAVVSRTRCTAVSLTAMLLTIARTAAMITTVGCSSVSRCSMIATMSARTIDSSAPVARRSRTRPGSIPVAAVRNSAQRVRHSPRHRVLCPACRATRRVCHGEVGPVTGWRTPRRG